MSNNTIDYNIYKDTESPLIVNNPMYQQVSETTKIKEITIDNKLYYRICFYIIGSLTIVILVIILIIFID